MTTTLPFSVLRPASDYQSVFEHRNLVSSPPHPACNISVAIPVRDEGQSIVHALSTFIAQKDAAGRRVDPRAYEVIVLANNCSDDTVRNAQRFALQHAELTIHVVDVTLATESHVGHARRLAMDEACSRLMRLGKHRGVIATTDGDTRVSDTWIAATMAEIQRGADGVGGRIQIDPVELRRLGARRLRYHLYDVGYRSLIAEMEARLDPDRFDPWPRHFQHFGASMAVTADAYLRSGGLPVRASLEDVAFHNALVRLDARIRHSPQVQVLTSPRRSGRTDFGFAQQLAQWEAMDSVDEPLRVESSRAVESRIASRRHLRHLWSTAPAFSEVAELARLLGVPCDWLGEAIMSAGSFGALLQDVHSEQDRNGQWRSRWPLVDVRDAIKDVRIRVADLRSSSGVPMPGKDIEPVKPLSRAAHML